MVPSLTPYDLSFPQKRGFHMPPTYANGHISATGDLIHFMFGSRLGFSGTVDRTALFTVRTNPRWWPPQCWKNFKWRYLRNRLSDALPVLFCGGVSGTADLMALFPVRTNPRWRRRHLGKISNGHISATGRISPQRLTHRAVIFAIAQLSCLNTYAKLTTVSFSVHVKLSYRIVSFRIVL